MKETGWIGIDYKFDWIRMVVGFVGLGLMGYFRVVFVVAWFGLHGIGLDCIGLDWIQPACVRLGISRSLHRLRC